MTDDEDKVDDVWDDELKHKERIFVLNYCTNEESFLNATESYRLTYRKKDKKTGKYIDPEKVTCESNGSKLTKRPRVKAAIRKLLKLTQPEKDEADIYRMINDLARQAFFNPADILTATGKLKTRSLQDLGETAKCICQIKPSQYGVEYTLIDRYKPMTLLAKYLNIVRPEQQIEVTLPVMEVAPKIMDAEAWNEESDKENE